MSPKDLADLSEAFVVTLNYAVIVDGVQTRVEACTDTLGMSKLIADKCAQHYGRVLVINIHTMQHEYTATRQQTPEQGDN